MLFVTIQLQQHSLITSPICIPIHSHIIVFNEFFDFTEFVYNKYSNADFLLMGDYNLRLANCFNIESHFNDKLSYFNFCQINHTSNIKNIILDYVLSNSISTKVNKNTFSIVPVDLLYPPITVTYKYLFSINLQFNDYVYNWNSGNYIGVINYLGSINWFNSLNLNYNINDDIDFLYSHINIAIINFIPKIRRHKLNYRMV